MLNSLRFACLYLFLPMSLLSTSAEAEPKFDLALVLAVDVSSSMDPHEQKLQRDGFVEAFRSPLVHMAIQKGMLGRVAVTYVEWSAGDDQTVVVPWTVIDGPDTASSFAQRLEYQPVRHGTTTSISGALRFSVALLHDLQGEPTRRVIDVSGDGPNNDGRQVAEARDMAVADGVTINGLPIMIKDPEAAWDGSDLDLYYRDCVIGGVGAFLQPLQDVSQFAAVIESKILREISGLDGRSSLVKPAGASVDCRTGEKKERVDGIPGAADRP